MVDPGSVVRCHDLEKWFNSCFFLGYNWFGILCVNRPMRWPWFLACTMYIKGSKYIDYCSPHCVGYNDSISHPYHSRFPIDNTRNISAPFHIGSVIYIQMES